MWALHLNNLHCVCFVMMEYFSQCINNKALWHREDKCLFVCGKKGGNFQPFSYMTLPFFFLSNQWVAHFTIFVKWNILNSLACSDVLCYVLYI